MCTNELIDDLKGEFDLPTIVYTPYTIFSNRIPLFDINFFNPMESYDEQGNTTEKVGEYFWEEEITDTLLNRLSLVLLDDILMTSGKGEELTKIKDDIKEKINDLEVGEYILYNYNNNYKYYELYKKNFGSGVCIYIKDLEVYGPVVEKPVMYGGYVEQWEELLGVYYYLSCTDSTLEILREGLRNLINEVKTNESGKVMIEGIAQLLGPVVEVGCPYIYYLVKDENRNISNRENTKINVFKWWNRVYIIC